MNNKNLLLGYGETLTGQVKIEKRSGPKNKPYTYEENAPVIMRELQGVLRNFQELPDAVKPNGEAIAKITLHPAFLAKSYFPVLLFKKFSLQSVGSKAVKIRPRKVVGGRGKPKEEFTSACIYVSGKSDGFLRLFDAMNNGRLNKGEKKEIITLESVSFFEPSEKIKSIDSSEKVRKLEVALHTPNSNDGVLKSFIEYATSCGAVINENKIINMNGLTFMPISANADNAVRVAEFSFLRAIRDLPSLRINNPVFTRTFTEHNELQLPKEKAINENIKVAIFDGGIGNADFEPWVKEYTFSEGSKTSGKLLSHGQDVTSTVLFGALSDGQVELPRPYAKIDHYRVLDNSIDGEDDDLFDVLLRIKSVLDNIDYDYINLSLGPRFPVDDDDVHVWTSTLEQYLSSGKTLCTVAVGNDGRLADGLNRIQPPSDLVNALAVGAASSLSNVWEKSDYSCIGPGRSPGFVKPDGVAFGGSKEEPFKLYSPFLGGVVQTAGTSFSSPLVLRQAIGLAASLQYDITPLTAKALLIHHAENNGSERSHVGWGRFPHDISDVIYCDDDEVKVIYQGELKPSQHLRASIPFPDIPVNGSVNLKATFCFTTPVDIEHPVNYTKSGLVVTMRKTPKDKIGATFPLFNSKNIYATEEELREDSHRWETTIRSEHTFNKGTLKDPCFDVIYYGRNCGMPAEVGDLPNLSYVLIVSLKAQDTPELYNNIRQRYQTLQPIQVKQQIRLQS
ncbi:MULTISPECIES: S8 family peptidase [unclassified Serratia (in: enterobacteria)]|uniref:S8 family peptidase n=1 Tax=unclassified Serratia (in: enterobacteria) TaxID=2647522 RepID=UPI0027FAEE40|nr:MULTISPECIES: S8 family peptidase [unclassified Serratia (in: enterobacteria)]MDQ7098941.1 S8 family peptidase [Serratia sp. MF2]MDQ7105458.1 S8 family peptidase [Serratia sp. MF1(2023)]